MDAMKWVLLRMPAGIRRMRLGTVKRVVTLIAALLVLGAAGASVAAPPAPNWMPNSPILAGGQVIVLWVPSPGAVKYNIYLNNKKVGDSASIQFILPAPEEAGEHVIQVTGVDAGGAEGPKSTPGKVSIFKIEPPKGLITRVLENKVAVRWDKAKGAVIYNIYRSEKKDGEYKLLASIQSESYTDADVKTGKNYFYAIASKDLGGKESVRTQPVLASLVVAEVAKSEAEVKYDFKARTTEETGRVGFIDAQPVYGVYDLKAEPGNANDVYAVTLNKIVKIGKSGDVTGSIGPIAKMEKLIKFDFGPDGNLYMSDARGNLWATSREGNVLWTAAAPKPAESEKAIWAGVPGGFGTSYTPSGGDVLCLPQEIWMSDQNYSLIYVFDYKGAFKRYLYQYTNLTGAKERMLMVTDLAHLSGDRFLITFSTSHYAVVLDKDMKELFSIGKQGSGLVGRFIGMAGVAELSDGTIVITDPAVNAIQAFDGKTGRYLYHIGGETDQQDPKQAGRALIEYGGYLNYAAFPTDSTFAVYSASERAIMFRKIVK